MIEIEYDPEAGLWVYTRQAGRFICCVEHSNLFNAFSMANELLIEAFEEGDVPWIYHSA